MKPLRTARDWFASGERLPYDPDRATILPEDPTDRDALRVFRRTAGVLGPDDAHWTTFLPGFPDGSYGWSRVDLLLDVAPRLFVEYVGQGDSDKPRGYPYGIVERANLVEAHWRSLGVRSTFVVAFDYSSLVTLELLRRQRERLDQGVDPVARIDGFASINGGLFADGHSHPWATTPLLKTPFGRVGAWFAQRSRAVFDRMTRVLYARDFHVTEDDKAQLFDAITRHDGARFLHEAAGFVDEHRRHADVWDLRRAVADLGDRVAFHVVGTEDDPFERRQVDLARERLGDAVDTRLLPGGHLATSEQPEALAGLVEEFVGRREAQTTSPSPTSDDRTRDGLATTSSTARARSIRRNGFDRIGTLPTAARSPEEPG